MMTGKTTCGFEFVVDEKKLDNMDLVDAIAESDKNPIAITKVITLILGPEQKQRLYEHLRTEDGRVPIEEATRVVVEIFQSSNTGKNS